MINFDPVDPSRIPLAVPIKIPSGLMGIGAAVLGSNGQGGGNLTGCFNILVHVEARGCGLHDGLKVLRYASTLGVGDVDTNHIVSRIWKHVVLAGKLRRWPLNAVRFRAVVPMKSVGQMGWTGVVYSQCTHGHRLPFGTGCLVTCIGGPRPNQQWQVGI